jgi:hypothetical protein
VGGGSVVASYPFSGIWKQIFQGRLGNKKKHEVALNQELFNCLVAAFQDVLRQKLLPEFLAYFAISVDLMWNGYPDSCYIDGIFCCFSRAIQGKMWDASLRQGGGLL